MADEPRLLSHPELVIGIAGPIGIDVEAMADEIGRALGIVGYGNEVTRKSGGVARTWYANDDKPRPLLPKSLPAYIEMESVEVDEMIGQFRLC